MFKGQNLICGSEVDGSLYKALEDLPLRPTIRMRTRIRLRIRLRLRMKYEGKAKDKV